MSSSTTCTASPGSGHTLVSRSHAFAHMFHATCSLAVGDRDQALQSIRKAHRLDPLSAIISYFVEVVEGWVGDPDAVITQHRVTEELAPGFAYLDSPVGDAYRIKGMHDDAVAAYRHAERVLGVPSAGLASPYAETGRTTEAEQGLADLDGNGIELRQRPNRSACQWKARPSRVWPARRTPIFADIRSLEAVSQCMELPIPRPRWIWVILPIAGLRGRSQDSIR